MSNEENKDLSHEVSEKNEATVNISISCNAALMVTTICAIFFSVFAPAITWFFMKNSLNLEQQKYLANLFNFQITIFVLLVISGVFFDIFSWLIGLFNLVILVIAAIKIANNENYKFPLTIDLIKVEQK